MTCGVKLDGMWLELLGWVVLDLAMVGAIYLLVVYTCNRPWGPGDGAI